MDQTTICENVSLTTVDPLPGSEQDCIVIPAFEWEKPILAESPPAPTSHKTTRPPECPHTPTDELTFTPIGTSTTHSSNHKGKNKTTKKIIKCSNDERLFSTTSFCNLFNHYNAAHYKHRFICECSKIFPSKYDLGQHITPVHDECKLICEICSKAFNNRQSFFMHKFSVHDTSSMTFQCTICKKSFCWKASLSRPHDQACREFPLRVPNLSEIIYFED